MPADHLAARLRTLRVTYASRTMSDPERRAWIERWYSAVSAHREPIPEPFVVEAFDYWNRTAIRMPAPGDIGNRARAMVGEARKRLDLDARARRPPAPRLTDPTPEEIEARREAAERLAAEFPMLRVGEKE